MGSAVPEDDVASFTAVLLRTGSIALGDADEREVHRTTGLVVEARGRVLEHLQLALGLSRRPGRGAGQKLWRTYG
jgi:hypothetical protein